MKELEKEIRATEALLKRRINQYETTPATNQDELKRMYHNISTLEWYLKGLERAKEFIEKENKKS